MSHGNISARELFKSYLKAHNLRKTPERFALLEKAMTIQGHFGVDLLYDEMERSGYHVSRATVYSTLELLVDCGLLNRHLFGSRKTSYEVALGSHFHLICSVCGKIREIEDEHLGRLMLEMNTEGFTPTYFSTMVYGVCDSCSDNNKQSKINQNHKQ